MSRDLSTNFFSLIPSRSRAESFRNFPCKHAIWFCIVRSVNMISFRSRFNQFTSSTEVRSNDFSSETSSLRSKNWFAVGLHDILHDRRKVQAVKAWNWVPKAHVSTTYTVVNSHKNLCIFLWEILKLEKRYDFRFLIILCFWQRTTTSSTPRVPVAVQVSTTVRKTEMSHTGWEQDHEKGLNVCKCAWGYTI